MHAFCARRGVALLVVLCCALALVGARPAMTMAAEPPPPGGVTVQLGPERSMFGPLSIIDMPFHVTTGLDGQFRGFVANSESYEMRVGTSPRVVLRRGQVGAPDQCGAWLSGSIYKDPANPRHWVSFYHAEASVSPDRVCRTAHGEARWSMAYAESWDGGVTWKKPTYGKATNQVLVQDTKLLGDKLTDDAGNGRVIVHGGYFYMFYMGATRKDRGRKINVARAPVSGFGRPGTWRKYHCVPFLLTTTCGYSQTALGGPSTHIALPAKARHIAWNSYLQRWIGVAVSGRYGFELWQSSNLTKWTHRQMIYPPVSSTTDTTVDKWENRTPSDRGVYGYPSIAGVGYDPNVTGRDFLLFYMRVYPGEGMAQRYLAWRRVRLAPSASPSHRVALTTYLLRDGRRRTSTEQPQRHLVSRTDGAAGHLLGAPRSGFYPLLECRRPANGDHYLKRDACLTGDIMVRREGYASPTRTSVATVPLYRCYDTVLRSHFASTSSSCNGKKREFLLGYVLPGVA